MEHRWDLGAGAASLQSELLSILVNFLWKKLEKTLYLPDLGPWADVHPILGPTQVGGRGVDSETSQCPSSPGLLWPRLDQRLPNAHPRVRCAVGFQDAQSEFDFSPLPCSEIVHLMFL